MISKRCGACGKPIRNHGKRRNYAGARNASTAANRYINRHARANHYRSLREAFAEEA